jgi:hypothetical protein
VYLENGLMDFDGALTKGHRKVKGDQTTKSGYQTTKSGSNYKYLYLEKCLTDFDGALTLGIGTSKETKLQSQDTKLQSRDQTTNIYIA